jgi:protein TonB
MTYASVTRNPNPLALAGALGIPGAIATLLMVGLAVSVVSTPPDKPLKGEMITETKLPPPPPPEPPRADPRTTNNTVIDTPAPPRPTVPPSDFFPLNPVPLPAGPGAGPVTGSGTGEPVIPTPTPSAQIFDPVSARPRNNPGR